MNKKVIIKIFLISFILIFSFCINTYAVVDPTTTRIKIDDSEAWTNISVSDSYAECEALNSATSTLATENLKAHLTTDYDWSAMAIFSVSQYGATSTNSPKTTSTTKNKSGIFDIGTNYVQTTTVSSRSNNKTTAYIEGLYDESGNKKKYVNKINPSNGVEYDSEGSETGRIAISYITSGGTLGWLGSSLFYENQDAKTPLFIKSGLFGSVVGTYINNNGQHGGPKEITTFRPVIWNH